MQEPLSYALDDLGSGPGWCRLPWPGTWLSLRESGDLGPSGFGEAALGRRQAAFAAGTTLFAAEGARMPEASTVLVATQTHSLRVICPLKDGRLQVWEGLWYKAGEESAERKPGAAGDIPRGESGPDCEPARPDGTRLVAGLPDPEGTQLGIRLVLEDVWDSADLPGLARRTGGMEADGWLTDHPGLDLGVTVADCMSLFFRGLPRSRAVGDQDAANAAEGVSAGAVRGLVHSGWQGTGIARVVLAAARAIWNLGPDDFDILAGPCITTRDYPVDVARARLFARRFGAATVVTGADGQPCLDLVSANAGLCARPILACATSTLRDARLQSYRRDGKESYGRMLALWKGRT